MKKLMIIISSVAIILVGGYSVYSSQNNMELSDLTLANVEAIAGYEDPDLGITCNKDKYTSPGRCWTLNRDCEMGWFYRPDDCKFSGFMRDTCLTPCDI